jgi:hypothetical protein
MKKWAGVFIGLLLFPFVLFAQAASGEGEPEGNEIPNQVDAIMSAQPGDYILLPSGNRYVLTREEILIANGTFDYGDLSDVASETKADGTVIKNISQAHEIQIYPDGKTVHIIKTRTAFASFLKHIEDKYHLMRYLDSYGVLHDSKPAEPPNFNVFRVFVQSEAETNGFDKLASLVITAYNYEGKNFTAKYCSAPNLVWGLVSSEELYKNSARSIDEKWEITTPGSAYSSFEFNRDRNYIAVEKDGPVHFGRYIMPTEDTINMEDLGVLKINEDKNEINLSFTPVGETEMALTALRAEKLPESLELDLFTRSWKVLRSSYNMSDSGIIVLFSRAGTYLVYEIDGSVRLLSHWRWADEGRKEFEFSHDKWETWGSVSIMELRENYLKWFEAAGTIELEPASN